MTDLFLSLVTMCIEMAYLHVPWLHVLSQCVLLCFYLQTTLGLLVVFAIPRTTHIHSKSCIYFIWKFGNLVLSFSMCFHLVTNALQIVQILLEAWPWCLDWDFFLHHMMGKSFILPSWIVNECFLYCSSEIFIVYTYSSYHLIYLWIV